MGVSHGRRRMWRQIPTRFAPDGASDLPFQGEVKQVRERERERAVTINAIVFDAYGTLYDVQSVADVTEEAFPGYGEIITQVWRIKQLEYTWLRSLMRRYQDFSVVTRDSLAYTLRMLGLQYDDATFARIMDKYLHLDLYPDAMAALAALKDRKLAILSNGSPDMLNALVKNTGLDRVLTATISVDANKVFKPSPEAYTLIEEKLGASAHRCAVRLLQSLGRLRRQGVWPQRRLDRAGDAGGDGARLCRERDRCPRSPSSRRCAPRWMRSASRWTIASARCRNCLISLPSMSF